MTVTAEQAEQFATYLEAGKAYELAGVRSRAFDRNWGGSAHQQAQDGFKEVNGILRATVRGMNAERAKLFRDAAALREARPGVDQVISTFEYGYVGASIGGFPDWGATAAFGANGADLAFHGRTDPGDQIGVRIGRELYERFPAGQQITPQHVNGLNQAVVDALRTNFDELVRTGKIRVR
jgi:hypothetical protein